MKICTLDSHQFRAWRLNRAVLVDSETGEAVLEDGKLVHPTKEQILGILKARKQRKFFDVEVAGKKCHFVNGRDFLKRTFTRIHQDSIQIRNRAGQVLGMARPKFPGHDLANSEVLSVDGRPTKYAKVDKPVVITAPGVDPESMTNTPSPEDCPVCSSYSKPLGCRQDEHHFVCRYHDAWEAHVKAVAHQKHLDRLEAAKVLPTVTTDNTHHNFSSSDHLPTVTTDNARYDSGVRYQKEPPPPPATEINIISLEDGTPLRPATPDEISAAIAKQEAGEIPILEIGGEKYAIGDENMALPIVDPNADTKAPFVGTTP